MKKTEKTALSGSMNFAYAGTNALSPVQGEKLVAILNAPNVKEGTWEWWRIENGEETKILNFFPEGDDATYYMIPSDETVGTTYKVKFTPVSGYSGSFTQTSEALLKYEREKYDAPTAAPQGTRQSDTTVTFKMGDDADEGIVYEFQYGTEDAVDSKQNKLVETKAYKGTDVTITGLNRNTGYHIWVRRAKDDNKDASEWCTSKLSMKTEQTEIHGYVSIDGIDTAGKELIATYNQASYIPTGDDGNGTWKWYRESSGGSYTEITAGIESNGVESRYTPTKDDIGKKLKVEYTGTGDFKASKTAVTTSIKKNVAKDPVINKFKQGDDTEESRLRIEIELDTTENVWYMIKDSNTVAPQIPSGTSDKVMTDAKWTKATDTKMEATKDVEGKYYAANTKYTLYIVKQESADTQVSNLISREVMLGTMTQTGTITYTGDEVVGKTITATMKDTNNDQGSWKWYVSDTDCGTNGETAAPSLTDRTKWKQLASGYSPTVDSTTSTLTLSEDMWKHYIKAEFVPNNEIGYGGESIQAVDSKYVRKIYNESIKIESSTKDGNGAAAAYPGTKITATIENWSEEALTGRLKAYINETTPVELSGATISGETLTVTLNSLSAQDGKNVYTELAVPNNSNLYVDESLKPITSGTKYKSDRIPYRYGIPIKNETDLKNFILKQGDFSSRGNGLYIITNNIKYTGAALDNSATGAFNGTLDGDYHSITGLKNALFYQINGANIKNIIFNDVSIDTSVIDPDKGSNSDYSASIVTRTQTGSSTLSRLFLSQANILSGWDTGYLIGKLMDDSGTVTISECSSGGGTLATSDARGRYVSGFVGFTGNRTTANISNSSSVMTSIEGKGVNMINGLVGGAGNNNIRNVVVASRISGSFDSKSGGIGDKVNLTNAFYDSTLSSNSTLAGTTKGTAKATTELIGTKLQTVFNDSSTWIYKDGYYPRLSWIGDHPISNLFSATRGAFTSVDGKTTNTAMFNGDISGTIKVPEELQKNSYSYKSSNESVLKVTEGGTIIPVGTGNATIEITYTELDETIGGEASNKYDFTVKQTVNALASVSVSGTTNPGQKLTATASGASTYQWYKRKSGSTQRVAVPGATSSTYTLQPSDIGYEFNVDVGASGYATMSSGY
ncbi:hypothetical protein MKC66_21365, partial [[Clostridium] innocuum]|nr:hypothetical protein [[Clostridium] innocuum]